MFLVCEVKEFGIFGVLEMRVNYVVLDFFRDERVWWFYIFLKVRRFGVLEFERKKFCSLEFCER